MSVLQLRPVHHQNRFHFTLVHICPFKSRHAVIAYGGCGCEGAASL